MSIKQTDMQKLSTFTNLDDMKSFAVTMLKQSRTDAKKQAKLINDIKAYNRPDKVLKLMWNAFLAGDGKGIIGSRYAKRMAEEVDLVEYYETMMQGVVLAALQESK